jgi:hypothetical protein
LYKRTHFVTCNSGVLEGSDKASLVAANDTR